MPLLLPPVLSRESRGLSRCWLSPFLTGGANRDRTGDLYNAIVALSQLSYGPGIESAPRKVGRCARRGKWKNFWGRPSVLLVLDVFDDLGHIVLVFAELGSVLEQFLVLLLGFF